jgi:hypothetical protein
MVLSGLLVNWEVGLLCAGMVVYLSPELMMIFSKRWRVLKAEAEREEEEYRREMLEEIERKYKGTNWDKEPLPPMERFDDTGCPGIMM